jgi:hypothetical protein
LDLAKKTCLDLVQLDAMDYLLAAGARVEDIRDFDEAKY